MGEEYLLCVCGHQIWLLLEDGYQRAVFVQKDTLRKELPFARHAEWCPCNRYMEGLARHG